MSTIPFITIFLFLGGIVIALIGVIYNILASRIKEITMTHNDLAVNLSSIRTDIKWIKQKLNKV